MDAEAAAPVVWIAPPSAEARRGLERWSAARGLVTREPAEEAPPVLPWDTSDVVERWIAEARDAVLTADGDRADRALAQAEGALRGAPALPHAAWLLAEVERARAARFADVEPKDLERAALAWARADDLDGGRAPGVGEPALPKDAPRAPRAAPRLVLASGSTVARAATGSMPAAGPSTRVELDGREFIARGAPIAVGEHHVRVLRGPAIAWAGWVLIAEGTDVPLPLAAPAPCSRADLGSGLARCPRWVTAREVTGAIDVAVCAGSACGAPTRFARPLAPTDARGGEPRARWPAWATWTLVGAGIAGGTIAVLAASGAFAAPPTEVRFVGGGVKPTALGP